jgi:hypothetical protein
MLITLNLEQTSVTLLQYKLKKELEMNKIEEIGISKIILGTYHIVLVCLLDLQ